MLFRKPSKSATPMDSGWAASERRKLSGSSSSGIVIGLLNRAVPLASGRKIGSAEIELLISDGFAARKYWIQRSEAAQIAVSLPPQQAKFGEYMGNKQHINM